MTYPPPLYAEVPATRRHHLEISGLDTLRRARGFVQERCVENGFDDELCHTAALLTTEVVTNALRYGGHVAHLRITASVDGLLVEVEDLDPVHPPRAVRLTSIDPTALGGRGLPILAHLASDWGSYDRPPGKVVWFDLRATAGARDHRSPA